MKKFVPLSKQSKLKQKQYHTTKRGSWGALNPVTRKPANPKAYTKAMRRDDNLALRDTEDTSDGNF